MNKLVVISMDALVQEDLEEMNKMPAFNYLMRKGSYVKDFRSIYPTLTYPCHITMSTGCYPAKHGIVNNTKITKEDGKDPYEKWQHYHEAVKCEDIIDVCKKAGYSTSIVGWPVSGKHPNCDYLVDEAWPMDKSKINDPEAFKEAYLATGTPEWLFDKCVAKHLWMRVGKKQPASSYFLAKVAGDIIVNYKPDIMIIHVGNVDAYRHISGVFSDKVHKTLHDTDSMLNILFDAAKEAGTFENTNFVVTSDHGQMQVVRDVCPNVLFKEKGFIKTDSEGHITEMKAVVDPVGMSAQVYVYDKSVYDDVFKTLTEAAESGLYGIEKVYTKQEVLESEGLGGDFDFVIETDGYSHFIFDWEGTYVRNRKLGFYQPEFGSHGFHPDKGPRPVFLACGPDICQGKIVEHAKLVDGAPTYAALMKVELKNADGKPIDIIKKEE